MSPYVMAFCAMAFSALSARTLFWAINHFDPKETPPMPAGETLGV